MNQLVQAFASLSAYRQFILWIPVQEANGRINKKPLNARTGYVSDAHNPEIWLDLETAVQMAELYQCGIGFVFTAADPFFFVDVDHCLINGQWSQLAQDICAMFPGALMEASQSGTGIHIIGSTTAPPPDHSNKNTKLGLELYTEKRFVALTGTQIRGDARTDHTTPLYLLAVMHFKRESGEGAKSAEWTTKPVPEWTGPESDDDLIARMLASKSGGGIFGTRASVVDLWNAEPAALGAAFPDPTGNRPFDWSTADMALCQHLAFWTGKNCERMEQLFRRSGLFREKWEQRQKYREDTILLAVGRCNNVYTAGPGAAGPPRVGVASAAPPAPAAAGPIEPGSLRVGAQFLTAENQVEYFKGCVYVRDIHRIFTPDGSLLKPDQFRAVYGGYQFALDTVNDKVTKNPWEAFVESQAVQFPKVHSMIFRPEYPTGHIIQLEGRTLVNTYVPIETASTPGDASPFVNHVQRMLPNGEDAKILLSYMAALVQNPGVKFQWAPMVQGVEGNGKTILMQCVAAAIGQRYSHFPNAQELGQSGQKFNAWIQNKLFIGINEIFVGDRREVADALKILITEARIEIQGKGADQATGDNRANFMAFSNYREAIFKRITDRRWCVFYSAHQDEKDLIREGWLNPDMSPTDYFPKLVAWLHGGGYAIVTHFLKTMVIEDRLNPAKLSTRAPFTSTTREAIQTSFTSIEQEILEAIDENRPGFAGGWVSSRALNDLLNANRDNKRIPPYRRKEFMERLGFVPHPGLPDGGRVNIVIPFENGRPRLYVRLEHPSIMLRDPGEITKAYMRAQGLKPGENIENAANIIPIGPPKNN